LFVFKRVLEGASHELAGRVGCSRYTRRSSGRFFGILFGDPDSTEYRRYVFPNAVQQIVENRGYADKAEGRLLVLRRNIRVLRQFRTPVNNRGFPCHAGGFVLSDQPDSDAR
jgi:hypothetical protein